MTHRQSDYVILGLCSLAIHAEPRVRCGHACAGNVLDPGKRLTSCGTSPTSGVSRTSLAVHLGNQPTERAGLVRIESADFSANPGFADRANLIHRNLGVAFAHACNLPGAPARMNSGGEGADGHCRQALVQDVETDDDDGSCFRHLTAASWIEDRPAHFVTLHFFRLAAYEGDRSATCFTTGFQGIVSRPSESVVSHSDQSSPDDSISRAVSSHESFALVKCEGRRRMPSLRSSIMRLSPIP